MQDDDENLDASSEVDLDPEVNVESPTQARVDLEQEIPGIERETLIKHEGDFPETPLDRAFRLSTVWIGILLLVTVVGVVGYQFLAVAKDANRSIEQLLVYFGQGGLEVGVHEPLADTAGAQWGQRAQICGQEVKIYRFSPETSSVQKSRLEAVQTAGQIEVHGKPVPAIVNGPFVLTEYEDNPREADLLRSFRGFGTF